MLEGLDCTDLPMCPDDNRFVQSFNVDSNQQWMEFFKEYGFVVLQNIFDPIECEKSKSAMWDVVENVNPGLQRSNSDSWINFKSAGKYGLSVRGPCFHPTLVTNRQNPQLISALSRIIGSEVLVSQDRFTIYRSTDYEGGDLYRTGPPNLHLDLNPWWWCESNVAVLEGVEKLQYDDPQDFIRENNLVVQSMGPTVQCVLNFMDNVEEDGGTIIVPRFHRYMNEWTAGQRQHFRPLPWYEITANAIDKTAAPLMDRARRVSMRAGSVLIWDQTLVHGSSPNQSRRCRMAQFLRAFPRHAEGISPARALRRAHAVWRCLETEGALDVVTGVGMKVFGLDLLCDEYPQYRQTETEIEIDTKSC
eukprot:gene9768-20310_t